MTSPRHSPLLEQALPCFLLPAAHQSPPYSQPSSHNDSHATRQRSLVPELQSCGQATKVPMGTCSETAEPLSKPRLFLPARPIPLELQVLGGGSSKLLLKGDFVADFSAVL